MADAAGVEESARALELRIRSEAKTIRDINNPGGSDEAAMIVLDNDETGAQTEAHQKRMMSEIAKLTAGSNGTLDEADYNRTVQTLLAGGSDPVITMEPVGAWTHAITDAALN